MGRFSFLVATILAATNSNLSAASTLADWPAYLNGPAHNSYTASDTITPENISTLHEVWRFKPSPSTMTGQPPPTIFSSPTVVGNKVYVGFSNGVFYALDLSTGKILWKQFLGFVTKRAHARLEGLSQPRLSALTH